MAEIVNLRQARKRLKRQEKAETATENRTRFGRSKAERRKAEAERDKTARDLDGKKLD